jgi:N6-L-threonylcarbamoyladenine synthase
MLILGIESSCDETAAAVLQDGKTILSNCVASQVAVHKKYGGVVPELASRHHLRNIVPIVNAAIQEAGIKKDDLDGVAVTQGPGLVGSLLVGISYAKSLCFSLQRPLISVNHIEGHIFSVPLHIACEQRERNVPYTDWNTLFPALALVVSGGHTSLFWVRWILDRSRKGDQYELVGRTRDDAAGEAFDKVAKLLHLGYPGGPVIDKLAKMGDAFSIHFPIAKINDSKLDFSFSGIKSAVVRYVQAHPQKEVVDLAGRRLLQDGFLENLSPSVYDILASFQRTVVESLFNNTMKAAETYEPNSIMVSGGVACNSALRSRFTSGFRKIGIPVYFPSPVLSTDNAAMIAAAGYPKLELGIFADMTLNADVRLKVA